MRVSEAGVKKTMLTAEEWDKIVEREVVRMWRQFDESLKKIETPVQSSARQEEI